MTRTLSQIPGKSQHFFENFFDLFSHSLKKRQKAGMLQKTPKNARENEKNL